MNILGTGFATGNAAPMNQLIETKDLLLKLRKQKDEVLNINIYICCFSLKYFSILGLIFLYYCYTIDIFTLESYSFCYALQKEPTMVFQTVVL